MTARRAVRRRLRSATWSRLAGASVGGSSSNPVCSVRARVSAVCGRFSSSCRSGWRSVWAGRVSVCVFRERLSSSAEIVYMRKQERVFSNQRLRFCANSGKLTIFVRLFSLMEGQIWPVFLVRRFTASRGVN